MRGRRERGVRPVHGGQDPVHVVAAGRHQLHQLGEGTPLSPVRGRRGLLLLDPDIPIRQSESGVRRIEKRCARGTNGVRARDRIVRGRNGARQRDQRIFRQHGIQAVEGVAGRCLVLAQGHELRAVDAQAGGLRPGHHLLQVRAQAPGVVQRGEVAEQRQRATEHGQDDDDGGADDEDAAPGVRLPASSPVRPVPGSFERPA